MIPHRIKLTLAHWGKRFRRRAVMARMKEGDVVLASPLLRRLSFYALLYRVFLGSRYVHSMLYLGKGKILHTTGRRGVVVERLPGKIFSRESYGIYRVPGLSRDRRRAVIEAALKRLNHRLDPAALVTNIPARWLRLKNPLWRLEANRLWCSRLICEAYAEAGIELVTPDKAGTVTSEDLGRSGVLKPVRA